MTVYYVEDDENIRQLVLYALTQSGIQAEGQPDDTAFRAACAKSIPDVVVLDIMLPILDGISVLRMLRKQKISTPVLLLTAKSDVADKINGLDSGADDYLTKPFVTGELLARIRALTRRTGEVAVDGLQFHNLWLDSQNYTLSYGQEQIKLSLKEYQIMEIFMKTA